MSLFNGYLTFERAQNLNQELDTLFKLLVGGRPCKDLRLQRLVNLQYIEEAIRFTFDIMVSSMSNTGLLSLTHRCSLWNVFVNTYLAQDVSKKKDSILKLLLEYEKVITVVNSK